MTVFDTSLAQILACFIGTLSSKMQGIFRRFLSSETASDDAGLQEEMLPAEQPRDCAPSVQTPAAEGGYAPRTQWVICSPCNQVGQVAYPRPLLTQITS